MTYRALAEHPAPTGERLRRAQCIRVPLLARPLRVRAGLEVIRSSCFWQRRLDVHRAPHDCASRHVAFQRRMLVEHPQSAARRDKRTSPSTSSMGGTRSRSLRLHAPQTIAAPHDGRRLRASPGARSQCRDEPRVEIIEIGCRNRQGSGGPHVLRLVGRRRCRALVGWVQNALGVRGTDGNFEVLAA